MCKIQGLSHITFICADLEKTAQMLKSIFDAEEVYASRDKMFSISKERFFIIAGIWIAIMEGAATEQTYNHVAFKIDSNDLLKFEEKIRSLGLQILPGRKRADEEGKSLYFYDYDNHLFELHTGELKTRLDFYNRD